MRKFTVTAIIVLATLTAMASITKPEPQKFLRKCHEITDKNLSKFMEEWHKWSIQHKEINRSPYIDTLIGEIFDHYAEYYAQDSNTFTVLPHCIWINVYDNVYSEVKDRGKGSNGRFLDGSWKGGFAVTPALPDNRKTLYLTDEIKDLLQKYAGGIWLENEKSMTPSRTNIARGRRVYDIKMNHAHIANLREFIPAEYGHWGGYWLFESMPHIGSIDILNDGCYVELRCTWNAGEEIFIYKNTPSNGEKIRVCAEWIE
jgi:hypothetical protein